MHHRPFQYDPPLEPPTIIYEDEHLVLVDKPSGLLSVPGKSADHKDCLETRLRAIYPELRLVHRLDHPTSGIMIFARTAYAQRHLGLQFEKRQTKKTYVARVWGKVIGDSGRINLPLICDWPNRPKQIVCFKYGKNAQTDWEKKEITDNITRLKLYPKTGRSHQLRVHCLALGHPILGDSFYAPNAAYQAATRLQLHAESLEFRHPDGGRSMTLEVTCPF